jgi:hypothetical protein
MFKVNILHHRAYFDKNVGLLFILMCGVDILREISICEVCALRVLIVCGLPLFCRGCILVETASVRLLSSSVNNVFFMVTISAKMLM